MLDWFDQNPARAGWIVWFLLVAAFSLVVRQILRPNASRPTSPWDAPWTAVILLLLAAGRWPSWIFGHEFHMDESAFIVGAHTLRHDPVFLRAVDGFTSGPLNFMALFPAQWLSGASSYLSARITGALLIAAMLFFVHHALVMVAGRAAARVATFPAIALEALTWDRSLLHYSSELLSIALIAGAGFLLVRRFLAKAHWSWNILGGAALGTVPFGKPQAAPLALAIGLMWIVAEWANRRPEPLLFRRRMAALVAGAFVPTIVALAVITALSQWPDLIAYAKFNPGYINAGAVSADLLIDTWLLALVGHSELAPWAVGFAITFGLLLPFFFWLPWTRAKWLVTGAAVAVVAAFGCIVAPGRPFLHYWQLMIAPATLLIGVMAGHALTVELAAWQRQLTLTLVLIAGLGGILFDHAKVPVRFLGAEARHQSRAPQEVVAVIRRFAAPGDSLAIWGLMTSCYVEAGLRQATRACGTEHILRGWGDPAHNRAAYLADLARNRPPVFLDAVGPNSFMFTKPEERHEAAFPELGAYIREHYVLAADVRGNRIYVLK